MDAEGDVGATDLGTGDAGCFASQLTGLAGELRRPDGRLMDYSHVGYRAGRDPIPESRGSELSPSVLDFGATADDDVDDTEAFARAMAATASGVLSVPPGRFIISNQLTITKSHFVLRGAGVDSTIIELPRALAEVRNDAPIPENPKLTWWSYHEGFLQLKPAGVQTSSLETSVSSRQLARVTANADRGATRLQVDSTLAFTAGDWVRLLQMDSDGTLLAEMHAGLSPGNVTEDLNRAKVLQFHSPLVNVSDGAVELKRELPVAVDTRWSPVLRDLRPALQESGIESMTFRFANTPYPGHHQELGYNAIELFQAVNCWVRQVRIVNADTGIACTQSFHSTIADVVIESDGNRGDYAGHRALGVLGGGDILLTRFDIRGRYVHDLNVDGYACMNVFSNGRGVDLNMDHHGRAPYATLWTELDLGVGSRPFESGGDATCMPHSGARSVYWNLKAASSLSYPEDTFGPMLSFVGFAGTSGSTYPADWWIESSHGLPMCHPNLHTAMTEGW